MSAAPSDPALLVVASPAQATRRPWAAYAWPVCATTACTLAGLAMAPFFALVNIAMVYLVAVVAVAARFGRGPAVLTSILCVAAFDFVFVPPRWSFAVNDLQYLVTFAVMLGVALVISSLTASVREQAKAQVALAEERAELAARAQRASIDAETEGLRNTLLASISHDFRTPLAVISGASSSLVERREHLGADERCALARSIYEQSCDMTELVSNVLQMTHLEGPIALQRDWDALSDIAGSVLGRVWRRLAAHPLEVDLPADLPLVRVDAGLIEQLLANLLENAAKYTPPGTPVRLAAERKAGELLVSVEDQGPGLPAGEPERLFAKFHRGATERAIGGVGLGLAICRAIVRLHGGTIWAERRQQGGAAFRFTLPLETQPEAPQE